MKKTENSEILFIISNEFNLLNFLKISGNRFCESIRTTRLEKSVLKREPERFKTDYGFNENQTSSYILCSISRFFEAFESKAYAMSCKANEKSKYYFRDGIRLKINLEVSENKEE